MNKPLVLVQGPCSSRSGYGDHTRDLTRVLIESGKYDVMIADLRWGGCPRNALKADNPDHKIFLDRILKEPKLDKQPDLHFHITVPNEFAAVGKWNCGITAGIETTICSQPWIEGLNRMDLNIVPSNHAKNVFQNSTWKQHDNRTKQLIAEFKLQKPVEVLFEGARTEIYKSIPHKAQPAAIVEEFKQIHENFCFLFVGHWLNGAIGQDRKDVGMLIRVFLESFKNMENPPALIMKTSSASFSVMDREEMLKKITDIKRQIAAKKSHDDPGNKLPNIYLLHGELTDEEMNGLYNYSKVKVHISFTKGEGFGRPLLEASLSGKPVIAPGWSGQADFLKRGLSLLLPGQLTNVHESAAWENVILKESKWFTVNYNYASQLMRDVYRNYKKYTFNAKKQAMINTSQFSFKKMCSQFLDILDKYVPEMPTQVSLNLPNLPAMTKVSDTPQLPKLKVSDTSQMTLPKLKGLDDVEAQDVGSGQPVTDEITAAITVPSIMIPKLPTMDVEETKKEEVEKVEEVETTE